MLKVGSVLTLLIRDSFGTILRDWLFDWLANEKFKVDVLAIGVNKHTKFPS